MNLLSTDAAERPRGDVLLELGDACGLLYDARMSSGGGVHMLFVHDVDPVLRGVPPETPNPKGFP